MALALRNGLSSVQYSYFPDYSVLNVDICHVCVSVGVLGLRRSCLACEFRNSDNDRIRRVARRRQP